MASFAKKQDFCVENNIKTYKNKIRCQPTMKYFQRCWLKENNLPGSSQSIKIGIELSIDKSIEIGKSDFIDIDCIDQSVEIDDTLVSFIDRDLSWFLPIQRIDSCRKIICSLINENWIHANGKCIDSWAAIESRRIKQLSLFQKIFKIFFFL